MRLRGDDRGLAIGLLGFFAIIVITALLLTLLLPAVNDVASMTKGQADTQEAKDVIAERKAIFGNIAFYGLFVAGIFILARAVLESRRPG